jgi:BirA family biotin operon repressor/biotin-[acetyl-CoA-carboxylase] ligase
LEIIISNTLFTGKVLKHLPKIDSTNNYAKEMLANNSPIDGTVILAEEQFAGRGQTGNIWQSKASQNITFSIIYQTKFLKATDQFWLNMAISLGVWSMVNSQWSIESENKLTTKIKWPNDIYVGNKKIAGILIENTIIGMYFNFSVIGIGLNVNQEKFSDNINATSLKFILGHEINRHEMLCSLLLSIEKYFLILKENKLDQLKKEYLKNLFRFDILSRFKKDEIEFEGKIIDVDTAGNILIQTKNDSECLVEKFGFKEISFVI